MQYGEWQLRDDSAYWKSQNIIIYPSTNSVDEGMVHSENNVRSIVRRITTQSYALRSNCFTMKALDDGKTIRVSAGEGNIQGYHIITNAPIEIAVPNTLETEQWTLGISLSYDAANNVTGDVVAYDKPLGDNEIFSGAYLYWFDKCTLETNYDKILVIGRVWARNGSLVSPNTVVNTTDPYNLDNGRVITSSVETDPHKELAVDGSTVRIFTDSLDSAAEMGKGVQLTAYDTLPENITTVFQYDSMKYPVEQDRTQYTKPPVFGTSLQDYINYLPDWYVSKYGDYMSGALRMDNLSIDRKIELDSANADKYIKDSAAPNSSVKYSGTEGIFISPRTLGQLTLTDVKLRSKAEIDTLYRNGGTIMSVVPRSYLNGIDNDDNLNFGIANSATYAALVAQTYQPGSTTITSSTPSDVGLVMHTSIGGRSRVSMYNRTDQLMMENYSANGDRATIDMNKGRIFVDSYNSKGIVIHSASETTTDRNIDFAFSDYHLLISQHPQPTEWRTYTQDLYGTSIDGKNITKNYMKLGVSCGYDQSTGYTRTSASDMDTGYDPYFQIGNIRIRSNDASKYVNSACQYRVNTIEVVNPGSSWAQDALFDISGYTRNAAIPYIRMMPGMYSRSSITEDFIQVGTSKPDDIRGIDAAKNTRNKIVLSKFGSLDTVTNTTNYTFLEHDFYYNAKSYAMNKLVPFIYPTDANNKYNVITSRYKEIGGIYSFGNIGCSSALLEHHTAGLPYSFNNEWVRFTRFRYDNDNDTQHSGTYTSSTSLRERRYGTPYNIEFNTTVKNQRANQIIWNYHPNSSSVDERYQPLTLSYIHDEYDSSQSPSGTDYPNKTYYDFNSYLHQNPTFGVRDFLRIDGGGLSIHGDINNPALSGDDPSENDTAPPKNLGITLLHGRVYGSVYNDYAETYEKADPSEQAIEGMLVSLDPETQKYKVCDKPKDTLVVGVISDNYGMLLGGKRIDGALDELDAVLQTKFFAVGVSGKVRVNVDKDVNLGDLLVSSSLRGLATPVHRDNVIPGTIIGKVVSQAYPVPGKEYKQCLMQIMLG